MISKEGYRLVMKECNRSNKPDLTLELFAECEKSFLAEYPRILIQLFRALEMKKDKELLYNYIEKIKQFKEYPMLPENVYQAIVGAMCACEDFENAYQLLENYSDEGIFEPSIYMYNDMIAATDLKTAKEMFQFLRGHHVTPPNADTYHSLIKRYGTFGKYQSAFMVFKQLERDEVPPTRATFRLLANIFADSTDSRPIDIIIDKMKEWNIQPDSQIIERMVYAYSNTGEILKARKLFYDTLKFQYGQTGNIMKMITGKTYVSLHHGYILVGDIDECEELIKEVRNSGLEDTLYTLYGKTITLCAEADPLRAFSLFQKMKEDKIIPTNQNYIDVICALATDTNRIAYCDKLNNLFAETEAMSLTLNVQTFHRLLNVFLDDNQTKHVCALIRSMIAHNITVPRKAYERLLLLRERDDRVDETLLESIKQSYSTF